MTCVNTPLHQLTVISFFGVHLFISSCQPAPAAAPATLSMRELTPAATMVPMSNQKTLTQLDSKVGTTEPDTTYGHAANVALKMDVYYPKKISVTPWPVVIFVHGGAWMGGDKATTDGLRDIPELVRRGYLVASLNYRLAPHSKFPAQIQDVKCAVRYLRAHAETFHLDPKKVGAWGASAGGHLVALLGLSDDKLWVEPNGEYTDQSCRIQAVADLYGPSDMTQVFPGGSQSIDEQVFGATSKRDPRLAAASPINYVTRSAPPFLLLHGEQDDLVPISQSEKLSGRLRQASVPVKFVVVKNAGHVFIPVGPKPIDPSREQITQMIADFFDNVLK